MSCIAAEHQPPAAGAGSVLYAPNAAKIRRQQEAHQNAVPRRRENQGRTNVPRKRQHSVFCAQPGLRTKPAIPAFSMSRTVERRKVATRRWSDSWPAQTPSAARMASIQAQAAGSGRRGARQTVEEKVPDQTGFVAKRRESCAAGAGALRALGHLVRAGSPVAVVRHEPTPSQRGIEKIGSCQNRAGRKGAAPDERTTTAPQTPRGKNRQTTCSSTGAETRSHGATGANPYNVQQS